MGRSFKKKCLLFHLKSFYHSWDIDFFPCQPSDWRTWRKQDLKFHDVMECLSMRREVKLFKGCLPQILPPSSAFWLEKLKGTGPEIPWRHGILSMKPIYILLKIFKSKNTSYLETWPIDRILKSKILVQKLWRKCWLVTISRSLLIFW